LKGIHAELGLDDMLQRSDWAMNVPYPVPNAVEVQRDWRTREASIARAETAYLDVHRWELMNIGDREHLSYSRMERRIERFLEFLVGMKSKVKESPYRHA
jgi:hypothetical protein